VGRADFAQRSYDKLRFSSTEVDTSMDASSKGSFRRIGKAKRYIHFRCFRVTPACMVFFCLIVATIFLPDLQATICKQEQKFEKAYDTSTDILVGRVDPYSRFTANYSIRVKRVYKGHASGHVRVVGGFSGDYILRPGSEYLIYAERADDSLPLHISVCSRTRERSKAAVDLRRLHEITR
jgi:hypothetical protein